MLNIWRSVPRTLSFNVHGVIYIPDDGQTAPIEKEIRLLADGLQDGPSSLLQDGLCSLKRMAS